MAATEQLPTTVLPGLGTRNMNEDNVSVVNFGDMYEQATTSGIVQERQIWQVAYPNIALADAQELRTFMRALNWSKEPFLWTPPGESESQWRIVSKTWNWILVAGINVNLSFRVREAFDQ